MKSSSTLKYFWGYLVCLYFLIWILFFEFILPANKIFPKPTIVLEAFSDLIKNYELVIHFLSSLGVVYLSIVIAFLIIYLLRNLLLAKENFTFQIVKSVEWFTKFFPAIIFGIFLIYWFPGSEIIEFIFAVIFNFFTILFAVKKAKKIVKPEYIESAVSLGASIKTIRLEIIWKSILPDIKNEILKLHLILWSLVIVFEFIKGGYGIGVLYKTSLAYGDISALVAISLLTGATIFLIDIAFKKLLNKLVFWE